MSDALFKAVISLAMAGFAREVWNGLIWGGVLRSSARYAWVLDQCSQCAQKMLAVLASDGQFFTERGTFVHKYSRLLDTKCFWA